MSNQNVATIDGEFRELSPAEIAEAVRGFREHLQMKQSGLAEQAGVTERTIQRVERGERVKDETLKQIAKALFMDERTFVGARYIPSQEKAFENAVKFLDDHIVVDVSRIDSPEDIGALLRAQGWIVDGSEVTGEARERVATLQDNLVDWGDIYSDVPAAEQLAACEEIFRQVKRIERLVCIGKYGVGDMVLGKVPCKLGILKFWPRDDPRVRLLQMMVPNREIKLW